MPVAYRHRFWSTLWHRWPQPCTMSSFSDGYISKDRNQPI